MTVNAAPKLYRGIGLGTALLAVMLFVAACAWDGLRPSPQPHTFLVGHVVRMFGILLSMAALTTSLAALQAGIRWPEELKKISAFCLLAGLLLYGLIGNWLVWETTIPLASWGSVLLVGSGLLYIGAVTTAIASFVVSPAPVSSLANTKWASSRAALPAICGLTLGVIPVCHLWYSGLEIALERRLVGFGQNIYEGGLAQPMATALGAVAVALAGQRWSWRLSGIAHPGAVAIYAVGSALYLVALFRWTMVWGAKRPTFMGLAGIALLSAALLLIAWKPHPLDETSSAAETTYIGGGVMLLLVPMWHHWLVPPQGLPYDVVTGREFVAEGVFAYPISMTLGALAVVVGLLGQRLAWAAGLRLATAIGFVFGSALFAVGLFRGVGLLTIWRLDITTVAGALLLALSLVANLIEVFTASATPA